MDAITREDLLVAGAAGVAAASLGSDALAATAAGGPGLPRSSERFSYRLSAAKPDLVTEHGSVTKLTVKNMPSLEGSDAAIFLLRLEPGGIREPHWHPNAWEIDYCVSGHVQFGIIDPAGKVILFELGPGDVAFVPQAWAHFIRNIGDHETVIPITFGNNNPDDTGLSTMFGGMPTSTFEQTLGMKPGALSKVRKPDKTRIIV